MEALTEAPRRGGDATRDCAGAPWTTRARVPASDTKPARSTTPAARPDAARGNRRVAPSPQPSPPSGEREKETPTFGPLAPLLPRPPQQHVDRPRPGGGAGWRGRGRARGPR